MGSINYKVNCPHIFVVAAGRIGKAIVHRSQCLWFKTGKMKLRKNYFRPKKYLQTNKQNVDNSIPIQFEKFRILPSPKISSKIEKFKRHRKSYKI